MKIAILASETNGPADIHLGNELIRQCDVPVLLMQKARPPRARRSLRKLVESGPGELFDRVLNQRFEAVRRREFARELAARFADRGGPDHYLSGPMVLQVEDVHDRRCVEMLREAGVELLFQNGAGIIRPALIEAFPRGILNVHHGCLPAIRGCHSIAWGLLEHRPEWIGVSVHLIDKGIDTGPVLGRVQLPTAPGATYASLFYEATVAGGQLLVEAVADLMAGRCIPLAGDEPSEYRGPMTRRQWLALRHLALTVPLSEQAHGAWAH